jgi:hypothetical protein
MIAATNPDVGPMTWSYFAYAVGFAVVFVAVGLVVRALDRKAQRHIDRARTAPLSPRGEYLLELERMRRINIVRALDEIEDFANGRTRNDR